MACLDTTLLIDLGSKSSAQKERAVRKVREIAARGESLATTRFNLAELYVGLARSNRPADDEKAIDNLLQDVEILDFNDAAARLFGSITGFLQQRGTPAGDMDVLIAATALAYGHPLVTRNTKHFRHIPDLTVEEY